MDLVNQKVIHKKFGNGIICSVDNAKYLNVKFEQKTEVCKFAYPQCFYKYLTLDNSKLQLEIISVIENWKMEEEMERQNAVHSCSVLSRMESFGSVLTTQRMFTRIC